MSSLMNAILTPGTQVGKTSAAHGEPLIVLARPLVHLQGVTKAYRTPAGDFFALRGIDLEIWPGEFVALYGRSGAGKSTLINVVTGIDRPTAGSVRWRANRSTSSTRRRSPAGAGGRWASSFNRSN